MKMPLLFDITADAFPDSIALGEKVAAVIISRSEDMDSERLAIHVRKKLRSTKTPEAWFLQGELPYSETGKLLRRQLKAELTKKHCN
tara:strand:- start:1434 stop:1694 length:261 start_codon:yes stop_codon:yes gene_type:complete